MVGIGVHWLYNFFFYVFHVNTEGNQCILKAYCACMYVSMYIYIINVNNYIMNVILIIFSDMSKQRSIFLNQFVQVFYHDAITSGSVPIIPPDFLFVFVG